MPRRKTASPRQTKGAPRRRAAGWQLVWVDQGPLRRKTASECGQAMDKLEKARAEWRRFEREDQPAFQRWKAATFGALMSRLREVEAQVRQKEMLVQEVEREMYLSGSQSYRASYARVEKRRNAPPDESNAHGRQSPPRDEADADRHQEEEEELDEFTQELLFEEFLRTFLGMNPDRMSDRQYAKMFADFKANVLGRERPEASSGWRSEPEPDFAPEPPKPIANRVKELYRLLVRRLHPDMRADNNAEVSAIWHDVQEAYASGNVERLEMLLAFTDIQSNTAGEHTSLFQMQSVLAELRGAFTALQRTMRTAKKDLAWNFARLGDRSKIESRLRQDMETTLAWHEDQLRQLEALIAEWSQPAKRRPGQRPPKVEQEDFSF